MLSKLTLATLPNADILSHQPSVKRTGIHLLLEKDIFDRFAGECSNVMALRTSIWISVFHQQGEKG